MGERETSEVIEAEYRKWLSEALDYKIVRWAAIESAAREVVAKQFDQNHIGVIEITARLQRLGEAIEALRKALEDGGK